MNKKLLLGLGALAYLLSGSRRNPDLPQELVFPRKKKDIVIRLTYEPFTVGAFGEGLQTKLIAVAHPKTRREREALRRASWKKDKRFSGWISWE